MPVALLNPRDLIGTRFGLLAVSDLIAIEPYKYGQSVIKCRNKYTYRCNCDCGGNKVATRTSLLSGHTMTCGCDSRKKQERSPKWLGHGKISGHYWGKLRRNAGLRNIEFSLTLEDAWSIAIFQEYKCAITGWALIFGLGQTASVDRVDSNNSYRSENIQWVHKDINRMKWDLSAERFIELCCATADYSRKYKS